MAFLDLFLGFVFFVLGAMALNRATKAAEPAARKKHYINAGLLTVAGLIFTCLYLFVSGPEREAQVESKTEARP